VISRTAFDGQLLSAAIGAGAQFVPVRATAIRRCDARWIVTTRDAGDIGADWLLGADGPTSLVRRSVSRRFERRDLSIATGYYVRGVTSREIGIAFEHDPSGYLWSFPRRDHLAIGVCAQADEASPATLLSIAKRWIDRHGDGHAPLERYSWPIPSLGLGALRRERPAGDRWLLLGDAAGMVDPITREGIYFALRSAEAAADSLASGGDVSGRYERAVQSAVFAELVRAARIKARFFQPRFSALLLTALQQSGRIRAIMADLVAGDQSYHGLRRRLIATLELRLMFKVLQV
jgi:flavin-dependent dehydrogenase